LKNESPDSTSILTSNKDLEEIHVGVYRRVPQYTIKLITQYAKKGWLIIQLNDMAE